MLARELLRAALVLASLVPASLVVAALFVSRRSPFGAALRVTSLTVGLSVVAVTLRALAALCSRIGFSADGSTIRSMLRGLVQLDVVSSPMLLLVCTLSLVVVRFSRTYLGAEGGQPGEVNARAAAALLNDADVRAGLAARGIAIPTTTHFVAALHDATTDDVALFDETTVPTTHRHELAELRSALTRASTVARRERAPRLGLGELSDAELHAAAVERSRSWAEVRPEWGLAGNAAFIVAPRERSRHLDLQGRAFLHDYRFEEDHDFTLLDRIMTGPMLVTHWINFQYYASTVDNARYGSGNKVLHNVVAGHIGVFEGNGGDLRIGLSIQSLHNGERWMHAPLRLAVFIEAPHSAIDRVLGKHAKLRELVDNEWLHLFQLDTARRAVLARRNGGWTPPP